MKMLQQTINGKDVIIIHRRSGSYIVIYDGDMIETFERPLTDQDISELNRQMEQARKEVLKTQGKIMGMILVDIMMKKLKSDYQPKIKNSLKVLSMINAMFRRLGINNQEY